jgi:hypothetical protein
MANFKRLFTPDWGPNLAKYLASTVPPKAAPTPDVDELRSQVEKSRKNLEDYKNNLQGSIQQILVRDENGKDCLIFKTSP